MNSVASALALWLTFLGTAKFACAQQYNITDIGTLPGFTGSQAFAISSNGNVAGTLLGSTVDHAFLYSSGTITDVGATMASQSSFGFGVNSIGQVAGDYLTGSTTHQAFLYSNGMDTSLGTLPNGTSSTAYGVNDSGQVVGVSTIGQGSQSHAFLYSNGTMTDLEFGSYNSVATAINDNGIAVGEATGGPGSILQAFGPLPPSSDDFWLNYSAAYAISYSGAVAGSFGPTGLIHAFLYANGVVSDLGTLGGSKSEALGVNSGGVVVGDSQFAMHNGNTHAFIDTNGTMYDLNNLIPANSGWLLTNATGINDSGEIVGYGTNPSGQADSFLLTPTPEPETLGFLALCGMVLLGHRRQRHASQIACATTIVCGVLTLFATQSASAQQYTLTIIGSGNFTYPYSVNDNGQAVGYSLVNGNYRGVLYGNGTTPTTVLGTFGGTTSTAFGINTSGQIVGYATTAGNAANEPFLYSGGVMTDLGSFGGNSGSASGINSIGQIVGGSELSNGASHPFLYQNGSMTDLGTLGGTNAQAQAINNSGQIAGQSEISGDTATHAFLYSNGKMSDLGTLGGTRSAAIAINDSGQVVGQAQRSDGNTDAFLYSNGVMTDLGSLVPANNRNLPGLGIVSWANGINDSGQVVGVSYHEFNPPATGLSLTAFLYENGTMTDLNTLIPSNSGFFLNSATAINNLGQIVGTASDALNSQDGTEYAYLLTPTPEPGSLSLWAVGVIVLLRRHRRQ